MYRPARTLWLLREQAKIAEKWYVKFDKGQKEHGADLGTVPLEKLLDELEAEHLDALSYIAEIRRRIINSNAKPSKKYIRRKAANS